MSGGELPKGWEWTTIADVAKIESALVDPAGYAEAWHLAPNHVQSWTGRIIERSSIEQDKVASPKHRFFPGQIIYSKIRPYLAKATIADADGLCSADMYPIRPYIDGRYLLRWMLTGKFVEQTSQHEGRTVLPKINQEALEHVAVPVAPFPEQRRIVEKIEALIARSRRAKEALDAIPALLDRYRQSVLAAAFRGDLTAEWREKRSLSAVSEKLFWKAGGRRGSRLSVGKTAENCRDEEQHPNNWQIMQVRQIAQLQPGYAFKSSWFSRDGVRLLRGTNIVPDGTRWEDVVTLPKEMALKYSEYNLEEGDIVIAMDRPVVSAGLKIARIVKGDTPSLLLQRVGRFRISPAVDPDYFWIYLHARAFINHILRRATGSDLPHVSANDIETAMIPVPPAEEQAEIVRRVASADISEKVMRCVQWSVERLATLDQSILAKAFRGELAPQDPNDEPASVLLERIRRERAAAGTSPKRGRRPKK